MKKIIIHNHLASTKDIHNYERPEPELLKRMSGPALQQLYRQQSESPLGKDHPLTKATLREMERRVQETGRQFGQKVGRREAKLISGLLRGRYDSRDSQGFIVTVTHNGQEWPLRGTVWAFDMSRAQVYSSREEAQAALIKAKPFMKAALFKKAVIKEAPASANDSPLTPAQERRDNESIGKARATGRQLSQYLTTTKAVREYCRAKNIGRALEAYVVEGFKGQRMREGLSENV